MRRIFLVLILFLLPTICWSDEYVLIMSKEDNVCQHMLKLYNEDLRKYGEVRYDEHEEFTAIKWESIKYYQVEEGKKYYPQYPMVANGGIARISKFDINNEGKEEIVIKKQHMLSGIPYESVYYFKSEDADYFKDDEFDVKILYTKAAGGSGSFDTYSLKELPQHSDILGGKEVKLYYGFGPHFYINPFNFQGSHYVAMKDNEMWTEKWLVILKYTQENKPKDICYYLKISDTKTKIKRRK